MPIPDAELSRPALVLAQRFVQRWDLHAHQLDDGSYVCVHEQLNVDHLFAHLQGEITLGAYLLSQESQARFIVLDADDDQGWERLGHLARALAGEDIPAYWREAAAVAICGCSWRRPLPGERRGPLARDCWPLTGSRGWNYSRSRENWRMAQAL